MRSTIRKTGRLVLLLAAAWLAPALLSCGGSADRSPERSIRLATTTSTTDTKLLDDLLPRFQAALGVRVDVVSVGSGRALALGRSGDVDVLLVHDREGEEKFMQEGRGLSRRPVMANDFVIVGPVEDPARIRGVREARAAFSAIADAGALFFSRGDDSGTHRKEKHIWEQLGGVPRAPWYVESGQGMGALLMMASEKRAYTLADRGTYLALRDKLSLAVLCEGDKELLNPYSVIVVNKGQAPRPEAEAFARWIVSDEARKAIAAFGVARFGRPLFQPLP